MCSPPLKQTTYHPAPLYGGPEVLWAESPNTGTHHSVKNGASDGEGSPQAPFLAHLPGASST